MVTHQKMNVVEGGSHGKPKKRKKLKDVKIDREEYLEVDKAELPEDAKFQGYDPVIIQDLRIETEVLQEFP